MELSFQRLNPAPEMTATAGNYKRIQFDPELTDLFVYLSDTVREINEGVRKL
jgi:hypothetical protein